MLRPYMFESTVLPRAASSTGVRRAAVLLAALAVLFGAFARPAAAGTVLPKAASIGGCEWYGSLTLVEKMNGSAQGEGWSWSDETTERTSFVSEPVDWSHLGPGGCKASWTKSYTGTFKDSHACAHPPGGILARDISTQGAGGSSGSVTASIYDWGGGTAGLEAYAYGSEISTTRQHENRECTGEIVSYSDEGPRRPASLATPNHECRQELRVDSPSAQVEAGSCTIVQEGGDSRSELTWTWSFQRVERFRDRFCNAGVEIAGTVAEAGWGLGELIHGTAKLAGHIGAVGLAISAPGVYCGFTAPPQPGSKTKPYMDAACMGLTGVSVGTGVASLFNIWNPPGWGLGAVSVVTGLLSTVPCAMDPPDPQFRVIPKPTAVRANLPRPPKGTSARATKATRSYVTNAALIAGVGQAMATCENRATGARLAGETEWERRQHGCAADYAARLAKLYAKQKALGRNLLVALKASGIRNTKISRSRAIATLKKLPSSVRRNFARVGGTPSEIADVQAVLVQASGRIRTPASLYAAVNSPRTRAAYTSAASAFTQLAREHRAAAQG